jgi:hypothetical protein
MREIRTYGLMRGCWPVRLARQAGVYSTGTDAARWPHRAVDLTCPRRRSRAAGVTVGAVPLLGGRRLGARRRAAQLENGRSDSAPPTSVCVIRQAAKQHRRSGAPEVRR